MFLYPVTLKRDRDGGFVVTFKDIPEAITQGETKVGALTAARDALETALDFTLKTIARCRCRLKPNLGNLSWNFPPASRQRFFFSTK
jgi:predicted RNase H-like HicB family nuclease